jgi:hypothetical protein
MGTFIKTTLTGQTVEVIGTSVCLDGRPEGKRLVPVIAHPNWRAIVAAAPDATHMVGRLTLTVDEAEKAQLAINAARNAFDSSPRVLAEHTRKAINSMLMKRSDD